MDFQFSGKRVLVAGGTGGLGRTVSVAFLKAGAHVVVTHRNVAEFEVLRAACGPDGIHLQGETVDVTDEFAVNRFIETHPSIAGQLDVLVNTVGGYSGGVPLWDVDSRTLDKMIALNLRAGFNLARAAARVMIKQGHGAITNTAAKAALQPAAKGATYAASKAAALTMMQGLAEELRGTGVRVNSILPSVIDTEENRKSMPNADFSKWPKPDDIARVILFLCSDDARVIHGASIPVYGDR